MPTQKNYQVIIKAICQDAMGQYEYVTTKAEADKVEVKKGIYFFTLKSVLILSVPVENVLFVVKE
jgi:hypothetical protein